MSTGTRYRLFALAAVFFTTAAGADTVIGRWCDRVDPQEPYRNRILKISERGDGSAELAAFVGTNPPIKIPLQKVGDVYRAVDEERRYQILPGDGDLQLFDANGPTRQATRLTKYPKLRECR